MSNVPFSLSFTAHILSLNTEKFKIKLILIEQGLCLSFFLLTSPLCTLITNSNSSSVFLPSLNL